MLTNAYMRNVDVEHFWSVQINAMEATIWAVYDLQSLAFFNCQINSNRPVNEIRERLKQH